MVSYFDELDWSRQNAEYLANSEDELRDYIDKQVLSSEFRGFNGKKDTLEIIFIEKVVIPYQLPPY